VSSPQAKRVTFEEYLEIERLAEYRSQFIDGEIAPMLGGTLDHASIVTATLALLADQLGDGPCGAMCC
jgi:Uma2 family endonuclease